MGLLMSTINNVIITPKVTHLSIGRRADGVYVVQYTIVCTSQYEAKVLYEDLLQRLNAGEGVTFSGKFDEGKP